MYLNRKVARRGYVSGDGGPARDSAPPDIINMIPASGVDFPPTKYLHRTHELVPAITVVDQEFLYLNVDAVRLPQMGRAYLTVKQLAYNFFPPVAPGVPIQPICQIVLVPSM